MSSKRMPLQAPSWTEFLSCPICHNEFTEVHRLPISVGGCGHTFCKVCLGTLRNKQCPFDQTPFNNDVFNLPINTALLQLVGNGTDSRQSNNAKNGPQDHSKSKRNFKSGYVNGSTDGVDSMLTQIPPSVRKLSSDDLEYYKTAKECIEYLALHLRSFVTNVGGLLSRPMQRKLVTLITCQLMEEEGRLRALNAAHSLGERTITELIYQHQNPQQLSTNLWASVRSRGCQFLGPSMQEEILKLILQALENGESLSRKVLIMFVVERLEPHFPQISKSSIGHVIQLLYRASCFKVLKREETSSVMQLKEEFCTFDALRKEHDTQIVQIATEAGLRISPEQWSSLLYGDALHKTHMMGIIEKIQTPSSFEKSIQELNIAVQRNGDPSQLENLCMYLKELAAINPSSLENAAALTWEQLAKALKALVQIINGFIEFTQQHCNRKQPDFTGGQRFNRNNNYKITFCRDLAMRRVCPRGDGCTFAHSEEELERYRPKSRKNGKTSIVNGGRMNTGPIPSGMSSPSKKEIYQPQYEYHAGHHSPALLNSSDELNTPVSSSSMPPYNLSDGRNKTYSRTFYPSMDYNNDVSTNIHGQFGSMSLSDNRNHHPMYHKPMSPIHTPYLDESAHAPMSMPAHSVGGQYPYHEKPYAYMGYGAFPPHMMPPHIPNNYHPNVSMGFDASGNVVLLMPYPYPYPFQAPNMPPTGPPEIYHHQVPVQNQVPMNNNNPNNNNAAAAAANTEHLNNMDTVEND